MLRVTNPHLKNNERSVWLHRAVLLKLLQDRESVVSKAIENLKAMRPIHPNSAPYFDQWETLLHGSLVPLVGAMTSLEEEFVALRQCSPFSGILSTEERDEVLTKFEAYWRANYDVEAGTPE